MEALRPADFGDPKAMANASVFFVRALRSEAQQSRQGLKLSVDFKRLLSMRPAQRILELRASGYTNEEIAGVLGYKDARSVRSQIVRHRIQTQRAAR